MTVSELMEKLDSEWVLEKKISPDESIYLFCEKHCGEKLMQTKCFIRHVTVEKSLVDVFLYPESWCVKARI